MEIAKRYNGEIINADAMQLYAGLPIITNKITAEEQQGIPHHLLGSIGLHEQTWVVGTFAKKALGVIDEIRSKGKLPILVGGTHYYTHSILFKDGQSHLQGEDKKFVEDLGEKWPILKEPTPVILEELRRVDPVMADRWHPNDHRKIQRSLEIYLQSGRKASDIYAEQREANEKNVEGKVFGENSAHSEKTSLRYPTLLFWLHAEAATLRTRLDQRVDKMIENGLLDEVKTLDAFAHAQSEAGKPVDETRGIWPSIGYKEVKPYVTALVNPNISDKELEYERTAALGKAKTNTRHYAKRQLNYIRIKLIHALAQANASKSLYLLDGSDVSTFEEDVIQPALKLADDFLTASNALPEPSSLSAAAADMLVPKKSYDLAATPENWIRKHCEICGVTLVLQEQWELHLKSKGHKRMVKAQKKKVECQNGEIIHSKRNDRSIEKKNDASKRRKSSESIIEEDYCGSLKILEP